MFVELFPERFNREEKTHVNVGSTVSWTGVLDCTKRNKDKGRPESAFPLLPDPQRCEQTVLCF